MGRPKGKVSTARERLIEAAGRCFRVGGYGGTGIDGLAREAGLTSGAFYAHFLSKADAFRLAITSELSSLRRLVERHRETHGSAWRESFLGYYLGPLVVAPLSEACPLATLGPDVFRGEDETRAAFRTGLQAVAEAMRVEGADADDGRVWVMLALLTGGTILARAVDDEPLREEIAMAVRAAALRL